ncbi:MAG: hypothetical protein CTY23_10815 [Methylomonas sp.]|nr:MAG: hypothetical protein CTY23_10815 [Methylomonas sp.]PPD37252.1 MAG: hypothetical protein CTY21_07360 [Methylomonas sp.]
MTAPKRAYEDLQCILHPLHAYAAPLVLRLPLPAAFVPVQNAAPVEQDECGFFGADLGGVVGGLLQGLRPRAYSRPMLLPPLMMRCKKTCSKSCGPASL